MSYKVGQKVKLHGKIAYVIECINENDPTDKRIQGWRYYVDSDGQRWSVTDNYLTANQHTKPQ